MKTKANCVGVIYQQARNRTLVNLELEGNCAEFFYKVKDKLLSVSAAIYAEKRSKQANAYYWNLVGEMAKILKISNPRMHNLLLRRYGTLQDTDGKLWYAVICAEDDKVLDDEINHLKPTSEVKFDENGNIWRTYVMVKGSSQYNKDEMSKLINGAVDEAKGMGLQTETPEEIERMMSLYEEHHSKP